MKTDNIQSQMQDSPYIINQKNELIPLETLSLGNKSMQDQPTQIQQKDQVSQFNDQSQRFYAQKHDQEINHQTVPKNPKKIMSSWKASWHHRFIQYWQSIFNRRIVSFSCFALQIGDVFIFSAIVAFCCFACIEDKQAKSSGNMASILMAATIVFGCRNGLLSYFFGLSLERALIWHQLLAWATLVASLNHWFHSKRLLSGYIIQFPIIAFIFFSIKPVRRYLWELFMKMHWILIIVSIYGCIAHKVSYALFAFGYFIIDVCYRMYTIYMLSDVSKQIKLEKIGNNITKISMSSKNVNYKGGQYFFLMIPKISYLQWHPFSVFSASYEDEVVFYVKSLGDWTRELYKIAGEQGKPTILKGYLDGPYGYHSIGIEGDKYKHFLCISGGIGVTPIISTAKEILKQMEKGRPVNSLHFIWTGRDSAIVESVLKPDELRSLLNQDDSSILKNFYHYSDKGDKKIEDIEKQAQQEQQQLVQLSKGRPEFTKYFESAYNAAKESGESLVAVLTCGPQQLIDTAEINSMKWSKQGIRFDCHQEVFDF
ncbi:ferric reductase-like transmembrane component family protein (macronuclear) [Tetrahymena thermophila SB210]|uniref:Ferric reductase-like transmembrane component family protein n=1 Tax=Tetrahymena thermophila (strain SB210) TaxID=312017 RepID=I7M157_TETTS|nr:ferric reductase-like transmembrane component family protein [Tetrahymena thermophila SB210]EAR94978.1 ferric reductase-like transmembrane component family protein [Tetrahymena thermophila SB210]|eukprot:XP_001015223.1 ferric reductase-like transmembrane component family protein [Tetrahymena thermophila SB210]